MVMGWLGGGEDAWSLVHLIVKISMRVLFREWCRERYLLGDEVVSCAGVWHCGCLRVEEVPCQFAVLRRVDN